MVDSNTAFQVEHFTTAICLTRPQISDIPVNDRRCDVNTIERITLTAPDGVKFEFGGINAIDYSVSSTLQNHPSNEPIATTWHLSKITTPQNNTVTFEYMVANPILEGSFNFWIQNNMIFHEKGRGFFLQLVLPVHLKAIKANNEKLVEFEYEYSKELAYDISYFKNWGTISQIISRVELWMENDDSQFQVDKHVYTNYFTSDPAKDIKWYQLSKIKLPNATEYKFEYTNLSSEPMSRYEYVNHSTAERLKLLSLSKSSSKGGSISEQYKFEYNKTKLPYYFSGHYDHSGFYNGKDFSYTFDYNFYSNKVNMSANGQRFYNSREGDRTGQYVCAEMLQKMEYPTGGYSIFEYEPNYVNKIVAPDRQSVINSTLNYPGGLRIKKIKNYSLDNTFIDSKAYYYVSNFNKNTKIGTPSGILGYTPKYYWDLTVCENSPRGDLYHYPANMKILTSGSTNQAYFNLEESAYVGYSEVIECTEDLNGNIQGYTKYKFSNFGAESYDGLPLVSFNNISGTGIVLSPNTPFTSHSKKRGQLLEKEIWDNSGKLKHGTYNKYTAYPMTDRSGTVTKEIRGIIMKALYNEYGDISRAYHLGGSYIYRPYAYLLSESTTKTVEETDTIQQTTYYEYNPEKMIAKEKVVLNETDYIETRTRYTGDLFREEAYVWGAYLPMKDKSMNIYPIEKITIKNNNVISSEIINYKNTIWNDSIFNAYPSERFRLETDVPIPLNQYQFARLEGISLIVDPRCKKYLTINSYYKNPVPDYIEDNSSKIVYLWSYNDRYPIAKIENTIYDDVVRSLDIAGIIYDSSFRNKNVLSEEDWGKINSLRTLLPNTEVSIYTYKPYIGITSMTDPSGVTVYYEYDSSGRLIRTKDMEGNTLQEYDYHYKN